VLADGTARCWGANNESQCGDGSFITPPAPTSPQGLSGATDIATGLGRTCALLKDGSAQCWGGTNQGVPGQLPTDRSTPQLVAALTTLKQIAVGGTFLCALLADGTVSCWGDNSLEQCGQPLKQGYLDSPTPVTGLGNVTQIALGVEHACALHGDGTVTCWGSDDWNQLPSASDKTPFGKSSLPEVVPGLSGVVQIAVGDMHTCVRLGDGTVRCWGDGRNGEIGAP
jgi:alpha-tubulin suppressor-like RCC1 family protein